MRVFVWLIRAFLFFTLFAFALNNQQPVAVNWFFGARWQAPMVIVVLAAFGLGAAFGVIATLPGAWRRRRRQKTPVVSEPGPSAGGAAASSTLPSGFGTDQPPRIGL